MTLVVLVIAVIVEATFVVAMEIIMRREYSEEYKISQQLVYACISIISSSALSTRRVPESAAGDGRGKRRGGGGGGGRGDG